MKFGDQRYKDRLDAATFQPGKDETQIALLAAHERVLTLEAEIKVLVDGAGKVRTEIEALRNELVFHQIYSMKPIASGVEWREKQGGANE